MNHWLKTVAVSFSGLLLISCGGGGGSSSSDGTVPGGNSGGTTPSEPVTAPQLTGKSQLTLAVGETVNLLLTNSQDKAERCNVSPLLPQGMVIQPQNGGCLISGRGEYAVADSFEITAVNTAGSDSHSLQISVSGVTSIWGDGPNPADFDHVVRMLENEFDAVNLPALINEEDGQALVLPASASPVTITSVELDDGQVISADAGADDLFKINIANDGSITLHKAQAFNYETDSHFYRLTVQLGEQQRSVLVRLYDEQLGNEEEPLKLDSYAELLSFSQGYFIADTTHGRFETITLTQENNHNTANLHWQLGNDIDASASEDNPFNGFVFKGWLDGNNHVISNLNLADYLLQSSHSDSANVKINNLGLVDLNVTNPVSYLLRISDSLRSSYLRNFFISGYLEKNIGQDGGPYTGVFYAPMSLSGAYVEQVYINMRNRLTGGYNAGGSHLVKIAGLANKGAGGAYFDNVYVNGSTYTDRQSGPVNLQANCLTNTDGIFWGMGPIYCSQKYQVTPYADLAKNNSGFRRRTPTVVSMLFSSLSDYQRVLTGLPQHRALPLNNSDTDRWYRFVTDRHHQDGDIVRTAGNGLRDFTNNGLADDVIPAQYQDTPMEEWQGDDRLIFESAQQICRPADRCYPMDLLGRSEAEFKQASGWSGEWTDNGHWDIRDGEWPVLKNMPYPHIDGASWMLAKDPGAAYQRYVYSDYLAAEKPQNKPLPDLPVFNPVVLPEISQGQAVDVVIPLTGGRAEQCYSLQPLPAGLELKLEHGECRLSGIATTDYPAAAITLVIANAAGSTSIELEVAVLPSLPQLLAGSPLTLNQGEQIDRLFANSGGRIDRCEAEPLPTGLAINVNEQGCLLSGIASQAAEKTDIIIRAKNSTGQHQVSFSITVLQPVTAPQLTGEQVLDWLQGTHYQQQYSSTGGVIENCEITPELPRGLRLEHLAAENSCVISGTPLHPEGNRPYRLTASNTGGSNKLDFFLGIKAQAWLGAGPSPYGFDHIAVLRENDFNAANPGALLTSFEEGELLVLETAGFPNQITRIELDNGQVITDENSLANLFVVKKQTSGNQVYLYAGKLFDFESDSNFYQLTVQLADKTETILVRLYDVQRGNSDEPLKLHSYDEFLSFTQGQLQLDNNLYEILEPVSNQGQHTAGLYTELGSDIDASESQNSPFPGFEFKGKLNGNNHVISNLHLADQLLESSHSDSAEVKINNLGLVDLRVKDPDSHLIRISDNSRNSYLRNFFISGHVEKNIGQPGGPYTGVFYAPLSVSGAHVEQVYINVRNLLTGGYSAGGRQLVKIAGLANKGSGGAYFDNVYVNGSTFTERQTGPLNLQANCLTNTDGVFWGIGPIYCSQQYKVTDYADLAKNSSGFRRRTPTAVSMLFATFSDYQRVLDSQPQHRTLPLNTPDSDRYYRFVTDRNYQDGDVIRTVGNGLRDFTNNGVADDVIPEHYQGVPGDQWQGDDYLIYQTTPKNCLPANACYPMDLLGRSESDFKQADGWSGDWIDNGHWDIEDGEWPVLKNMPYPRTPGAGWLDAPDPGVAYQRETYNNYLSE